MLAPVFAIDRGTTVAGLALKAVLVVPFREDFLWADVGLPCQGGRRPATTGGIQPTKRVTVKEICTLGGIEVFCRGGNEVGFMSRLSVGEFVDHVVTGSGVPI